MQTNDEEKWNQNRHTCIHGSLAKMSVVWYVFFSSHLLMHTCFYCFFRYPALNLYIHCYVWIWHFFLFCSFFFWVRLLSIERCKYYHGRDTNSIYILYINKYPRPFFYIIALDGQLDKIHACTCVTAFIFIFLFLFSLRT